jgi:hypothetical protein
LSTPQGKRLYEEGRMAHGRDLDRLESRAEQRQTITKLAWDRIAVKAEQIQKADPLRRRTFAKCVDMVCRQSPELYEEYRNS